MSAYTCITGVGVDACVTVCIYICITCTPRLLCIYTCIYIKQARVYIYIYIYTNTHTDTPRKVEVGYVDVYIPDIYIYI